MSRRSKVPPGAAPVSGGGSVTADPAAPCGFRAACGLARGADAVSGLSPAPQPHGCGLSELSGRFPLRCAAARARSRRSPPEHLLGCGMSRWPPAVPCPRRSPTGSCGASRRSQAGGGRTLGGDVGGIGKTDRLLPGGRHRSPGGAGAGPGRARGSSLPPAAFAAASRGGERGRGAPGGCGQPQRGGKGRLQPRRSRPRAGGCWRPARSRPPGAAGALSLPAEAPAAAGAGALPPGGAARGGRCAGCGSCRGRGAPEPPRRRLGLPVPGPRRPPSRPAAPGTPQRSCQGRLLLGGPPGALPALQAPQRGCSSAAAAARSRRGPSGGGCGAAPLCWARPAAAPAASSPQPALLGAVADARSLPSPRRFAPLRSPRRLTGALSYSQGVGWCDERSCGLSAEPGHRR